jgi:tetratricopeptide (TPR) repeat protein
MSSETVAAEASEAPSGKSALRRRLQEMYDRGRKLSAERSFDYAHEMFAQCVAQEPGNLPYVETMLANLAAKVGDKKKAARLPTPANCRSLKKAIGRKDWKEALRLGIEDLKTNPRHVPTLRALAEVCAARHHNEVELAYLKQALEAAPRDADVNRHCARSLARMCQFDQAIACWHRVEIIHPGDKEASRMVFQLNEEKILHAAALKDAAAQAKKSAPVVEQPTEEETTPAEAPEALLNPRQKLERAIDDDPTNVELYLDLSELLIEEHRLIEGEEVLQRCIATCGEEARVRAQLDRIFQIRADEQAVISASQRRQKGSSARLPWLEMTLVGAAIALVMQVAPKLMSELSSFMQTNSKILLLLANAVGLGLLFLLRAWFRRAKQQSEDSTQAQI